jgi:hypothetical protein
MTHTASALAFARQDQFGRRLAARLDAGAAQLPHDLGERLRAARMQAVARRKVSSLQTAPADAISVSAGGQATLGGGDDRISLWQRVASALPLIVLLAGLVTINVVQNERRAREVADVDAALLIDDLPPAAYADPGFVQFLKSGD